MIAHSARSASRSQRRPRVRRSPARTACLAEAFRLRRTNRSTRAPRMSQEQQAQVLLPRARAEARDVRPKRRSQAQLVREDLRKRTATRVALVRSAQTLGLMSRLACQVTKDPLRLNLPWCRLTGVRMNRDLNQHRRCQQSQTHARSTMFTRPRPEPNLDIVVK